MKEISVEEKAMRYDDRLKRAQKWYVCNTNEGFRSIFEDIFPELKESEDERIRKFLHNTFTEEYLSEDKLSKWHGEPVVNILAWLEKKGEQKLDGTYINVDDVREDFMVQVYNILASDPTNDRANQILDAFDCLPTLESGTPCDSNLICEVKPKFKVGDTIRHKELWFTCKIIAVDGEYILSGCNGTHLPIECQGAYELVESDITCNDEPRDYSGLDPHFSKPIVKVEPKFKVGDWITDNNSTFQIVRVENEWYHSDDGDKICFDVAHQYYHLWNIQDAKEGDILATTNKNIFIFKTINGNTVWDYCGLYFGKFCASSATVNGSCAPYLPRDYSPATKEQCDLLFQQMKEEGYEWDANRKELKQLEQNSAWSEEDEEMIEGLVNCMDELEKVNGWNYVYVVGKSVELKKVRKWVKSYKERIGGKL